MSRERRRDVRWDVAAAVSWMPWSSCCWATDGAGSSATGSVP